MTAMATATHVPAWKRLGIKLKYANDTPSTTTEPVGTPKQAIETKKRPREINDPVKNSSTDASEPRTKRVRENYSGPRSTPPVNGTSTHDNARPNKSKKHVSFSSQTSVVTGDKRQVGTTARPAVVQPPESSATENESQTQNDAISTTNTKQPRTKSRNKTKTKPKTKSPNGPSKPPAKSSAALDYLRQYTTSRSTWKYNTNRETWILKHLFSEDDIPATDNYALAQYIKGIESVGKRAKLIDECRNRLTQAASSESGAASDNADDEKQKQSFLDTLEGKTGGDDPESQLVQWAAWQRRDELLLWALGESNIGKPPTKDLNTTSNGKITAAVKKKRKNRTVVVEYSSSSDSESSSSGESEAESSSSDDSDSMTADEGSSGDETSSSEDG